MLTLMNDVQNRKPEMKLLPADQVQSDDELWEWQGEPETERVSEWEREMLFSCAYLLEGVAKRITISGDPHWSHERARWQYVGIRRQWLRKSWLSHWAKRVNKMAWATTRPKRNRGNISPSGSTTKTQARLVMVEKISTDHQSLARERWQRKQRIRRRPKIDDGNSKSPTKNSTQTLSDSLFLSRSD